ncbi:MAG: SCP2 sterol-binding domain-containing protein [Lachnospiraceae bacterium]|jgi:putative sterol carrier protein|nr:SCP2 sterol-binding domain-containing protein [Lachnospiraceae bacterium]
MTDRCICIGLVCKVRNYTRYLFKRRKQINKLIDGKLDPVVAFTIGKLKVDGDVGKALEFSKLLK